MILVIGIIVVCGFLGGLVSEKLKFPKITGYIIVGMLLSPSLLNVIPKETVGNLNMITDIALGVIAYLIGGSLQWENLRKLKKDIVWITPLQSLGTWFLVTSALAMLGFFIIPGGTFWQTYFPMAFIIGAISCATAPATTMATVNEQRARGPLTMTLLSVVALDDAIAVIAFAIALGISQPLVSGAGAISFYQMLGSPFLHILESVAIGAIFGIALIYISRFVRARQVLLAGVFGTIMLCAGVTSYLGLSSILANMVVGFIVVNKVRKKEMFVVVEELEGVLYAMFFVLAGLHFDLRILKAAGILALLIVLTRCVGKYVGTRIGSEISHASESVKRYLGLALLPKAGVTVGLVLLAAPKFPTFGAVMLNAVLASTIINELIAPPLTKYAIFKAGEVGMNVTEEDLIKAYTVKDVMDSEPTTIPQNLPLQKILEIFSTTDSVYYPVIDSQSRIIGKITIPSIKEMFANQDVTGWLLACDVAEPILDKTTPKKPLEEAMEWMRRYDLECVPVVASDKSDKFVGILDYRMVNRKISAEVLQKRRAVDEMTSASG